MDTNVAIILMTTIYNIIESANEWNVNNMKYKCSYVNFKINLEKKKSHAPRFHVDKMLKYFYIPTKCKHCTRKTDLNINDFKNN